MILNLLSQSEPEINRLKNIDEFIKQNQTLITSPLVFQANNNNEAGLPSKDTLDIRGSSYKINEQMKKDTEEIFKIIPFVSKIEILRIVSQISSRHSSSSSSASKSTEDEKKRAKLEDPEQINKEEKQSLYINSILRERTTIIKLINFLLTHTELPELGFKYSTLILESCAGDFICNVMTFIKQIYLSLVDSTIAQSSFSDIIITQSTSTIVELLKLLISVFLKISVPSQMVKQWFQLLEDVQFFSQEISSEGEITSLSSIVSVLALGLDTNSDDFDFRSSTSYLQDADAITTINNIIVDYPSDAIVLYGWSILLGLIEHSVLLSVFGMGFDIDQHRASFAIKASEMDVFQKISKTHHLLSYDTINSAILASFLIAVSPFIPQLTDEISKAILTVFKDAPNRCIEKFFVNEDVQNMVYLSKVKFPQIIKPYLRILSINGSYAHSELSEMETYMSILPASNDLNYETDFETDTITLKEGHYLKFPLEQASKDSASIYLPSLTKGKLMPTVDQNLEAAIFKYKYNGWSLIGRILQNITFFHTEEEEQAEDLALVILELITNTIVQTDVDITSDIFTNLSSFIDDGDIIDLILKLFEQSLHQTHIACLTQLIKLLTCLLARFPQIVWSHLVRSDLLERRGRGGLITTILGAVETVVGDYKFTIEVLKFFNALVDCGVGSKEVNVERLDSYKLEVLPKFVNFTNQVFESFMYWEFKDQSEKFTIGLLILNSYSKILNASYGVDPETRPSQKITGVFASSAERILGSFTSISQDVRIIKPILLSIESLNQRPSLYQSSGKLGYWFNEWTRSYLKFSKLIISIRSLNNLSACSLEKALFGKTAQLISIYNQFSSSRILILQLLTQLVKAPWPTNETPSLLSHLGEFWTNSLVLSISQDLKSRKEDFTVKKSLYCFFSAVIEANQRGLSMIFLSGHGPNNKPVANGEEETLLHILKKNVDLLEDYYPEWVSIHLVDAIACALNTWSLQGQEDVSFAKKLIQKLSIYSATSNSAEVSQTNEQIIQSCYQYKLNSRVAEICALLLFSSTKKAVKDIIIQELNPDKILTLAKPLYEQIHYKSSLHTNLNKNFGQRWPEYKLQSFIRTSSALSDSMVYGEGAVYDLSLLDEVVNLGEFQKEITAASLNLQYVSAQVACAKSWGALLTVYAKNFPIKLSFMNIVAKLLQANLEEGVEVGLLKDVYRVRVELAFFFLFSKTTEIDKAENKKILQLALELITSVDVNFLVNLSKNEPSIYRPLLRIISNCLASNDCASSLESLSGELLEFFDIVIAKGTVVLLDSIPAAIHEDSDNIHSKIEDLKLLIAIVKALFATKPPSSLIQSISKSLSDFNSLRSILNIYSSSHLLQLKNDDHDYIFAELSLAYIIELISTETIAQQLLHSGLFSTLIQSPISVMIQNGQVTVQKSPRLHNIWRNGLLAIVLILLSKFGVKVLPESSAFVSYFTKQFHSSIQIWITTNEEAAALVTVPYLEELEQIIMLEKALETLYYEFGQNGTSSKFNQQDEDTIEIVPGLDTEKGRRSLQSSLKNLLAHPKFLTSKIIPCSLEEQILFEGEDKIRTKLVEKIVSQINDIIDSLDD